MLTVERIEDSEVFAFTYLTDESRVSDRSSCAEPIGGYSVWNARDENDDSPLFLVAG